MLNLLQRHFSAAQNRTRAQRHVLALRALSERVEQVDKLEDAVYAGRGADDWVVDILGRMRVSDSASGVGNGNSGGGGDVLKGTKIAKALDVGSHRSTPMS